MNMEVIDSGTSTVLLLNHLHIILIGPIDPQTFSRILSTNPSSPILAGHLSLLTGCVYAACFENQHPVEIWTYSSSSLPRSPAHWTVKFQQPSAICLLSLLFVSNPVCIPFHVFACISVPACLPPWGGLEVWLCGYVCMKGCVSSVCTFVRSLDWSIMRQNWAGEVSCWTTVINFSLGQAGQSKLLIELWLWRTGKLIPHCWDKDGRLRWPWKKMSPFSLQTMWDVLLRWLTQCLNSKGAF